MGPSTLTGSTVRAAGTTGVLLVVGIVARLLAFVRDQLIAFRFGNNVATDTYYAAQTLPNLLFGNLGSALSVALVPVLARLRARESGYPQAFCATLFALAGAASLGLAVMGYLLAEQAASLVAAGVRGDQRLLMVELTRFAFLGGPLLVVGSLLGAYLISLERFLAPALAQVAMNFVVATGLTLMQPGIHIRYLMLLTVCGYAATVFVVLVDFLRVRGFAGWSIDWRHPGLSESLAMVFPILMGAFVSQAYSVVKRRLSSGLGEGSISALSLSLRLMEIPVVLVGTAVSTALFPGSAALGAAGNLAALGRLIGGATQLTVLALLPVAFGAVALSVPVVRLLFERGHSVLKTP